MRPASSSVGFAGGRLHEQVSQRGSDGFLGEGRAWVGGVVVSWACHGGWRCVCVRAGRLRERRRAQGVSPAAVGRRGLCMGVLACVRGGVGSAFDCFRVSARAPLPTKVVGAPKWRARVCFKMRGGRVDCAYTVRRSEKSSVGGRQGRGRCTSPGVRRPDMTATDGVACVAEMRHGSATFV